MEEMITINVWISGRSYRIKINPSEEELVRKAVKVADEKVMEMRNAYAGKDDQDFIAMVLLMYAADTAIEPNHNPTALNQIVEISNKIDSALASGDSLE
jgi:cell division protein ZapA